MWQRSGRSSTPALRKASQTYGWKGLNIAMDRFPVITVRIGDEGALIDVEVEGHTKPTELTETQASEPMPSFGDEEYKERVRPWLYAG